MRRRGAKKERSERMRAEKTIRATKEQRRKPTDRNRESKRGSRAGVEREREREKERVERGAKRDEGENPEGRSSKARGLILHKFCKPGELFIKAEPSARMRVFLKGMKVFTSPLHAKRYEHIRLKFCSVHVN
jgi:hypothetical protein